MNLTKNEIAVLAAIDASEYGDTLGETVWTFTIADHAMGMSRTSLPGIVSSLVKKGALRSDGSGKEATVAMTDAGVDAYIAVVGTGKTNKPRSWLWDEKTKTSTRVD